MTLPTYAAQSSTGGRLQMSCPNASAAVSRITRDAPSWNGCVRLGGIQLAPGDVMVDVEVIVDGDVDGDGDVDDRR